MVAQIVFERSYMIGLVPMKNSWWQLVKSRIFTATKREPCGKIMVSTVQLHPEKG